MNLTITKLILKTPTLIIAFCLLFGGEMTAQNKSDFYDATTIHDVKITFDQPNWANSLDSLRLNGDDMLVGKVIIDGNPYSNVGISYAKSPTYQTGGKRNPWLIRLNFIDKKQTHQGIKTVVISQALRDPSLVREVLGYEIMRQYIPTPKANHVNLTVNDDNRGVYVNIEAIDEPFLQRNFGSTEGVLLRNIPDTRSTPLPDCNAVNYGSLHYETNAKCYIHNFELLSKGGWDDLIECSRIITQEPQNIQKILNIDRTLWYLALQNTLVNLNSYGGQFSGNYYLYRDLNGLFTLIPTELNLAFGSLKSATSGSDLDFEGLVSLDPLIHSDNAAKPLISQLLKNQDFKKIYFSHMRQILTDWFENDLYKTRADALQKGIQTAYINAKDKPYELSDFQRSLTETVGKVTKIPGIVELMSKRTIFLKKYPDFRNVPPKVSDIKFSNRERFATKSIGEFHIKAKVDFFPRRVRIFYRPTGSTGIFTEAQMFDDGKSHDAEAGDKIFGTAIQPKGFDAIEYYILAESAAGVSFEPQNYFTQLRKISLAELNK